MKIGCFALIQPFSAMKQQFEAIRELGIHYADLTDNHDGATLGTEFGFSASVSLESHPERIGQMLGETGIELTSVCAHANLLDPPSPDSYGSTQIVKAIKLAHFLKIEQVITTEGDPKTEFGESLTPSERLFAIREKLYWPVQWAQTLGIQLLLEPHGIVTDSVSALEELLEQLGHPETVGINLDTGNSWLGGAEPLEYISKFGSRIKHVHWKDMPAEWKPRRGSIYGCGMATIPLGDGVVGIAEIVQALKASGFDGPTTLEVAGEAAVKTSAERLQKWWETA